jgi:preprotein translocase subunit SecG
MDNFQLALLILQVIIAVLLVILVLVQKTDGDSLGGIGGGSGGLNSVISSKASANFLTKFTFSLVAIFMINCLILASISGREQKAVKSNLEKVIEEENNKLKTPKID